MTDSGREVRRGTGKEGIENLISIMSVATGEEPDAIEARYDGAGYGDFKTDVAEAVVELVGPIQSRYRQLRNDPAELQRLLEVGAQKARAPGRNIERSEGHLGTRSVVRGGCDMCGRMRWFGRLGHRRRLPPAAF